MRRALIVDDNRALAEDLGEILELEGYEVTVFDDPERALAETQGVAFDVALIDVRMPGLDGVALHRCMRGDHPETAFVLMTAYADDERIAAAMAAGVRRVLTKPVPIEELLSALSTPFSPPEVLVVDDDAAFNENLSEILRASGYRVQRAHCIEEARARFDDGSLPTAIVDVNLPDGDGTRFAADLAREGVSVLLVTGADIADCDPDMLHRVGGRGHFLLKPFDPEELLRTLGKICGDRP